jgi:hypothetical protein
MSKKIRPCQSTAQHTAQCYNNYVYVEVVFVWLTTKKIVVNWRLELTTVFSKSGISQSFGTVIIHQDYQHTTCELGFHLTQCARSVEV